MSLQGVRSSEWTPFRFVVLVLKLPIASAKLCTLNELRLVFQIKFREVKYELLELSSVR